MKKYISITIAALFLLSGSGLVHAQTTVTPPVLYNSNGSTISGYDAGTGALTPGWYYNSSGNPLYYYANGVYYDPAAQSYGGAVTYPNASGPQTLNTATPGAPNTGAGGNALYFWLALLFSGAVAVVGASYLARE